MTKLLHVRQKGKKSIENKSLGMQANSESIFVTDDAMLLISKKSFVYLRVGLKGGGCSGLTLYFTGETQKKDDDIVLKEKVLIDKKSFAVLKGAVLDVAQNLDHEYFVLNNNPLKKPCSCGKSFAF